MKPSILRGVPSSLRQDGWWLDPIIRGRPAPDRPHAAQNSRRYILHTLLLALLIAVAQAPMLTNATDPAPSPGAVACGSSKDLGFHAAAGLRSLAAFPQQGTPQQSWPIS